MVTVRCWLAALALILAVLALLLLPPTGVALTVVAMPTAAWLLGPAIEP